MRSPRVAGAIALLLFASACSSVPTHGDATVVGPAPLAGAPADAPDSGRRVGPKIKAGATPLEVVGGFLEAEADTSTEGTVRAQEYLPARNPGVWDADGETLVYTDRVVAAGEVVSPTVQSIRVTFSLLARINANGEYRPDVRQLTQAFEVTNVAEGWRISNLPRGRRINKDDLGQVFNRVVPYFYSTLDYDTLVPEPIYQLKEGTKRVYALVSRLVAGPTPVLEDFLPPKLFPTGTKLLTAPEPDNGIAELTFNNELNNTTMAVREKIVAQLVWTLTALDSRITAITVKVGDQPLTLATGGANDQRQAQWAAYDPDTRYAQRLTYFNLQGGLGLYRTTFVRPGRSLRASAAQPAVDSTTTTVAVTAPAGTLQELRVGPVATVALVSQLKSAFLTKPSWGTKEDGVWVVGQDGGQPPRVWVVPADSREPRTVKAPELNTQVYAFEVSPDGLRVAAIVDRDGHRSLEIGFIDRPLFDRTARRVAGFRSVVDGSDVSPLAVTWLDSGKLAFVGQSGGEDPEVFTVLVDGSDLAPVDAPTSKRSQRILQSSRVQGEFQLLPLPFENDSARRGSSSTPTELMLVIDTKKVFVHRINGWVEFPATK